MPTEVALTGVADVRWGSASAKAGARLQEEGIQASRPRQSDCVTGCLRDVSGAQPPTRLAGIDAAGIDAAKGVWTCH